MFIKTPNNIIPEVIDQHVIIVSVMSINLFYMILNYCFLYVLIKDSGYYSSDCIVCSSGYNRDLNSYHQIQTTFKVGATESS